MSGMNFNDKSEGGSEPTEKSDLAVMDVEEYKQKRRLRRILDAREGVEDIDNQALQGFATGSLGLEGKRLLLLRSVKHYIRECYNLLHDYRESLGQNEIDEYWERYRCEPLGRVELGDEVLTFHGLKDILNAEFSYTYTEVEECKTRHGTDQTKEHEHTVYISEQVLWNAYNLLNRFLKKEMNLDLSFEDQGADPLEV